LIALAAVTTCQTYPSNGGPPFAQVSKQSPRPAVRTWLRPHRYCNCPLRPFLAKTSGTLNSPLLAWVSLGISPQAAAVSWSRQLPFEMVKFKQVAKSCLPSPWSRRSRETINKMQQDKSDP
jgi:hypothetical protein